jgi:hypothetical protein
MKLKSLFYFLYLLLISCRNSGAEKAEKTSDSLNKEVISITEVYVKDQLKDPRTTTNNIGIITIENNQKKFIIDPREIFTGFIDDDEETDAIITINSYLGQDYYLTEHLIMINTQGKLLLIRSFEKDMKILRLNDRIITAEIHTKPRSSPLYNCESCKAIVNYKYSSGDLLKTE